MESINKKTYIAYAIRRHEYSCGCTYCTYMHVYTESGNSIKLFTSYMEAKEAAIEKMDKTGADDWNVI